MSIRRNATRGTRKQSLAYSMRRLAIAAEASSAGCMAESVRTVERDFSERTRTVQVTISSLPSEVRITASKVSTPSKFGSGT